MTDPRHRVEKLRRRAVSLPALAIGTLAITATVPIWLPISLVVDLVRLRWRFPMARLLAMGVCWCWIESLGVARAFGLWARGRSDDHAAHYELMAWWSAALMRSMRATAGMNPRIEGVEDLVAGDAIILARHASLGDSLLSGWALVSEVGLQPRYVLKKELLFDPCLDIVGLRVPNHFLDREAIDGSVELEAIADMASGIGPGIVGVIFAEGTRTNAAKRARALAKIAEREPERAERLGSLRRLLPPRPAGSMAMLDGAPDADVVLVWHTGFDGLDSFAGMMREVARGLPPVRFVARRYPRDEVPEGERFVAWLDDHWLAMDAEVDAVLSSR